MQTLGLSDSTPKTSSRLRELFCPDLSAEPSAESACDGGAWACFAIAGITTVFGLLNSLWVLIDAVLFLLIGFGLRKKNRAAAVAGFVLYGLETIGAITGGRPPGVLTILILAILFNSVRASFAYERLRKIAATTP